MGGDEGKSPVERRGLSLTDTTVPDEAEDDNEASENFSDSGSSFAESTSLIVEVLALP